MVVTIIGVDHQEGGSTEDISMSIKSNNCASTDWENGKFWAALYLTLFGEDLPVKPSLWPILWSEECWQKACEDCSRF